MIGSDEFSAASHDESFKAPSVEPNVTTNRDDSRAEKGADAGLEARLSIIESALGDRQIVEGYSFECFLNAAKVEVAPDQAQFLEVHGQSEVFAGTAYQQGYERHYNQRDNKKTYLVPNGSLGQEPPEEPFGNACVKITGNVKVGEPINGETFASNFPTYGGRIQHEVHSAEPSEKPWASSYYVKPEDAKKIWQQSRWWEVDRATLMQAVTVAHGIDAAQRVWLEQFPGMRPGDLNAAAQALNIRLDANRKGNYEWVNKISLLVPDFLLMDSSELLSQKRQILEQKSAAGDEKARELLQADSTEALWEDLQTGLENLTHINMQRTGYGDAVLVSDSLTTGDPALKYDYYARTDDPNGQKTDVAYAYASESMRYRGEPVLRLSLSDAAQPSNYLPGSLKWERVEKTESNY